MRLYYVCGLLHLDAELLKPGDQALPGMRIAVVGDLRQIVAGIVVALDDGGALLRHADVPAHICLLYTSDAADE